MPTVRGSLHRGSRISHPVVRGSSRRCLRLSHPAVRGSSRRRSRVSDPAVRGSSRQRSRINQPTVRRRWHRRRPRLTLAHRPAAESMPAGLPLTHARRPASDSCPPACLWLKPAGLPLTHARCPPLAGKANSPLPQFTPPSAAHRPAVRGRSRRRPWGKPIHHRRLPLVRGESQLAVRASLGPQPAEAPSSPPAPAVWVVKPAGCCRYCQASRLWSRQPAAAVLTSQPAVAVYWPDCDPRSF